MITIQTQVSKLKRPTLRADTSRKTRCRQFGFLLAGTTLGFGLWPLLGEDGPASWLLVLSVVLVSLAAFRPLLLESPLCAWMTLGGLFGHVMAHAMMTILFFCVLTPTALVLRLVGMDILSLRRDGSVESYWTPRKDEDSTRSDMTNQF
jgi:hypothetical protein